MVAFHIDARDRWLVGAWHGAFLGSASTTKIRVNIIRDRLLLPPLAGDRPDA